jgi:hypothetical protein
MESLLRRPQVPAKGPEIESWDDQDFEGIDNLQFRNASTHTNFTSASVRSSHHRDSIGSRVSARSDLDEEGDWQLLLANDDEVSTRNAIENAKKKGIPLPSNVPPSALIGGTIKKLGGRRVKKVAGDDWSDDIELPAQGASGLKLKMNDGNEFPESLRQVSGTFPNTPSPPRRKPSMNFMERLQAAGSANLLDKFKDEVDDFFDDVPTIKVAKSRSPVKMANFSPTNVKIPHKEAENFEDDFELPATGNLKLSARKEAPKTPSSQVIDDFDMEWAEGSQGSLSTSFGGVHRFGKSARSSSISARSPSIFSPSLSSCLTAESEDEGLDGLVLPDGPLKLEEALVKRIKNISPQPVDQVKVKIRSPTKDDFLDDFDLGPGPVFDSAKITLNRNIKIKQTRQASPPRRPATSLTFTNKLPPASTRIPKPAPGLERPRSKLEPVAESGGPISHYRNTTSRLGTHSQQSSLTSIPTPTSGSHAPQLGPSTPSRRGLTTRTSRDMLRPDSSMHGSAQFLKNKRSLPAMSTLKATPSPARGNAPLQRPNSRSDKPLRSAATSRPKTPVDRSDSSLAQSRKPPIPFLPAGNSNAQARSLVTKSSRTFHRPTSSDSANEKSSSNNRSGSRLSDRHRSNTPTSRRDAVPESLARMATSKKQLTHPVRRRGYGDGSELDGFDDLPTSSTGEAKFLKQSSTTNKNTTTSRGKTHTTPNHSISSTSRAEATPRQLISPPKSDNNVPSFARSTAASRLAREQRLGPIGNQHHRQASISENQHGSGTNWKAVVNAKSTISPRHKRSTKEPKKPQLIKPMGHSANESKVLNGMHWNPQLFRWEGNEGALAPFDVPSSPKRTGASPVNKPALIANPGTIKGIQVVGGMVFDPERMRWFKVTNNSRTRGRSESGTMSLNTEEDEEDPFKGIDDLEDESKSKSAAAMRGIHSANMSDDEPMVGEEFDVGPEFIRRQKHEEEKWTRKLKGWMAVLDRPEQALQRRNDLRSLVMEGASRTQ